jgi:hypothetical protein
MKTKDYLMNCWASRDTGSMGDKVFFWKCHPIDDNGHFCSCRSTVVLGHISYLLFLALYGLLRKGRCIKLSSIKKRK